MTATKICYLKLRNPVLELKVTPARQGRDCPRKVRSAPEVGRLEPSFREEPPRRKRGHPVWSRCASQNLRRDGDRDCLIASRVIGISSSKPEDPSEDLQWEDEPGSPAKVARTPVHGSES
ncbi:hypothetical protein Bca101_057780 [Brassica carinata]